MIREMTACLCAIGREVKYADARKKNYRRDVLESVMGIEFCAQVEGRPYHG